MSLRVRAPQELLDGLALVEALRERERGEVQVVADLHVAEELAGVCVAQGEAYGRVWREGRLVLAEELADGAGQSDALLAGAVCDLARELDDARVARSSLGGLVD